MVALPCGSRSTISTRWPTLARPAERFTVVVVLPTPPFWLATQKILAIVLLLPRHRQPHPEADQTAAGELLQHAPDRRVGAHALGQKMREQHRGQPVRESQHRDG